ncbi:MAG: cyclase family protein [Betaproteobacteria bacterium]|nr:cyclase family protein [Betaproteobacteria bacterium]
MVPKNALKQDVTLRTLEATAARLKNWGKWGPNDELGTLNYVTPAELIKAAALVRKGKAFSLGLDFNQDGPQRTGWGGRFNPIHTMLATGTDAVAGRDSTGAKKNGIHKTRDRMVGRGVLLDIPRWKGGDYLEEGYGIGNDELDACARAQGVEVTPGDFVIVRTGQMEHCLARGDWGTYAAGDAPGLRFETAEWIHRKQIAAICCDTWGCEVRPNESTEAFQPWHWIVIPMIGITMGEIFYLKDLAADCAQDKVYEFLFCAPTLSITGAVGSPINPIALK